MVFLCELMEKNITIIRSKQANAMTNAEKAKGELTKKLGSANQGKVKESLLYGKVGGSSKYKDPQSDMRGSSFASAK